MLSIDEQRKLILKVAAEEGIDGPTALAVAKSEGWGQTEYAVGDEGMSGGPFQLYSGKKGGGGLGTEFTQLYGQPPGPENMEQQIRFALRKAAKGGRGWGPWYGWKGDQYQGLPGGPQGQVVGRRGRTGEVAQVAGATQSAQPGQPQQEGSLLDELRKMIAEKQKESTLGEQAVLGLNHLFGGNATKTQTLGSAVLKPLLGKTDEEQDVADAAVKGYNSFAPKSRAAQTAELTAPKTVGSSIMGMFAPPGATVPGTPKKKTLGPTLWTTLFG